MKAVLDTSAIIYLNDFRMFEEIFTVSEVVEEVKDRISVAKLAGIKLSVLEPGKEAVKQVKEAAANTGDAEKMSGTDFKVLALAKEYNLVVVSDDYNIQNVAQKLGVAYLSVVNKITKSVKWASYCNNCRKFADSKNTCPNCGGKLARRPKESIYLSPEKSKLIENQKI
ncbi:MAG: DUF1272 domain-containing protein [Candidatus Aenigmarchaeota archaeon]|nr:DUF1272 domain-containing protein [Candidatus Aenigmarchaeota archaeon]